MALIFMWSPIEMNETLDYIYTTLLKYDHNCSLAPRQLGMKWSIFIPPDTLRLHDREATCKLPQSWTVPLDASWPRKI